MEKGKRSLPHCVIVPHPSQGHLNPLLQFSKRLAHKGVKVTLAVTHFIFSKMKQGDEQFCNSITVETISDGYDQGGLSSAESLGAYLSRFRLVGSQTLGELLDKLHSSGCPVDCVIYDGCLPWALDVAKEHGLVGAAFFTQSAVVDNICYRVHHGLVKIPLSSGSDNILIPGLPPLAPIDMPSVIYGQPKVLFDMVMNQYENVDKADWVLCNTFYKLDEEVVDWMTKHLPLRTIGPTLPSMYLDKQIQDDKSYGPSLFKPDSSVCMKWLNDKPNGSVVYVSFGSLATLQIEQMEELAWGLKGSNNYFMWVVRPLEEVKLPKNFVEAASEKGLVVSWCPQLEVLAHKAVGCFVTHCGWNSTLEALSLGVPMVAMPQWGDQTTNAKYLVDVWGVGLRTWRDDKGIVRREMVEDCIREAMEGEKGKEIKINASKWRNLAREALEVGGSSDRNIDEFVSALGHSL